MHPKVANRNDHNQNQRDANKTRLLTNEDEAPDRERDHCYLRHVCEKEEMLSLHHRVSRDNLSRTVNGTDIQTDRRGNHDKRDEPKHRPPDDDL
jgi:hypothetical protein